MIIRSDDRISGTAECGRVRLPRELEPGTYEIDIQLRNSLLNVPVDSEIRMYDNPLWAATESTLVIPEGNYQFFHLRDLLNAHALANAVPVTITFNTATWKYEWLATGGMSAAFPPAMVSLMGESVTTGAVGLSVATDTGFSLPGAATHVSAVADFDLIKSLSLDIDELRRPGSTHPTGNPVTVLSHSAQYKEFFRTNSRPVTVCTNTGYLNYEWRTDDEQPVILNDNWTLIIEKISNEILS